MGRGVSDPLFLFWVRGGGDAASGKGRAGAYWRGVPGWVGGGIIGLIGSTLIDIWGGEGGNCDGPRIWALERTKGFRPVEP